MTASIDQSRPERAWGVASVPAHPYEAARTSATPADEVFDRPEPSTGLMNRFSATIHSGQSPAPASPPEPRTRSDRHRRSDKRVTRWRGRLRTIAVIVVLLVAAGVGGMRIVQQRLADQAFVNLGSVSLTADAVPVGFAEAVVVTTVTVSQHAQVTAGQKLATVTSAVGTTRTLTAPVAGTVAAVEVGVGGVARGGEAIVTLYDQARLTFRADVPLPELRRMRVGMTAYIEGPGLAHRITTTLDHVVPVVGGDQSSGTDRLTVVLIPTAGDRGTVSTLVPGLRFNARVDTHSAPGAVPAVNTG